MGGVSADGKVLWVSGRYNGVVYAIDTTTGALLHKIRVGSGPHGLCVFPQPGALLARPHRRLPLSRACARSRVVASCALIVTRLRERQRSRASSTAHSTTATRPANSRPRRRGGADHGAADRAARPRPRRSAAATQRYEPALPIAIQEAAAAATRRPAVRRRRIRRRRATAARRCSCSTVRRGSADRRCRSRSTIRARPRSAATCTSRAASRRAARRIARSSSAPGASSWRELAPMHRARGALALVALGGRLYAIGGRDRSASRSRAPEVYDPAPGRGPTSRPCPRRGTTSPATSTARSLCVAGGRTPDTSARDRLPRPGDRDVAAPRDACRRRRRARPRW